MFRLLQVATLARAARACLSFVLFSVGSLLAQQSSDCLGCHEDNELTADRDGRKVSMYFDAAKAKQSVHAAVDCISCHVDLDGVKQFPHPGRLKPATCDNCHDPEMESMAGYWNGTHGKAVKEGKKEAPRCADCHGGHYIVKRSDPSSPVYPLNVPATCSQCHAQGQPVARSGALTRDQVAARYKDSIHGPGLFRQGLKVAPNCVTCHSAHAVLPHTDPASSIHKDKVNDGCAHCHNDKEAIHKNIVAPELWTQPGAVPLCVDCHQPHGQRRIPYGTNMSDGECLKCHGDRGIAERTGKKGMFVDGNELSHSIHGRKLVACAQCHSSVRPNATDRPCSPTSRKVQCAACHEDQVVKFERGIHGSLAKKGEKDAPTCISCHGSHTIVEHEVPADAPAALRDAIQAGPTHRRNVPNLCARCHKDGGDATKRNPDAEAGKIEHYRKSVHGKGLLESGLVASANCVDCHSAHMELPPSDPASTVAPENIVQTCGKCHDGIHDKLRHSVHSAEANPGYKPGPGQPHLPHCNDCHSAHSVARTDLPQFRQTIVEQCGKCHAHITETYFETYHGKASKLGNDVAARCYDCHGSHDILSKKSEGSKLSAANIVDTCAKCHPNSNPGFTGFLAHATHTDKENHPQLYWAYQAMTWLLVGTFGFFGLHLLAWLPKSWQLRRQHRLHPAPVAGAKEYLRFTPWNRMLHVMIIVSFLGLATTGMALKFSTATWAKALAAVFGGPIVAGWIHRFCAVITFAYFVLHLYDLVQRFRRSGKTALQFFLGPDGMMPQWRDVTDMIGTIRWFVGLGPRPRYGKWTYWEKFDYFAVFWGVGVIGLSGLILWFPETFTRFLPGWIVNVATIIHSEEALLATGFIFTIHFFNTHMRPEKFPMDRVVFTGRMTVEELKADKPGLYDELVQRGELEKHLVDPPTPFARRAATIFGSIALTIGVIVIVLIVHGLLTVGI